MILSWTSTPPSEPGWYWVKIIDRPEVLEVAPISGQLHILWSDGPRPLPEGYLWAGPIPQPS